MSETQEGIDVEAGCVKNPDGTILHSPYCTVTELGQLRSRLQVAQANRDAAMDDLKVAQAAFDAVQHEEYRNRSQTAFEAMMALPDEAFVAENPRWDERPYILPFGRDFAKWNPIENDDEHEFGDSWTANMTAIICERLDQDRSRPTRLVWTSGLVMPRRGDRISGDCIGQTFLARHDQTGAKLGEYRIAGLAFYGPDGGRKAARVVGNVPNVKFGQSTYK